MTLAKGWVKAFCGLRLAYLPVGGLLKATERRQGGGFHGS